YENLHSLCAAPRRLVVVIAMGAHEQIMAGAPNALKIDLRFGNSGRKHLLLQAGALPGDLPRQSLDLGGQRRIDRNRRPQSVAQCVARRILLAGGRAWTVLARALARLALRLRALITRRSDPRFALPPRPPTAHLRRLPPGAP